MPAQHENTMVKEVADLINELALMALDDPLRDTPEAECWLSPRQRPRTIEIGRRLNELGGFGLMYYAHSTVLEIIRPCVDEAQGLVRGLEMAWDHIGEWRG